VVAAGRSQEPLPSQERCACHAPALAACANADHPRAAGRACSHRGHQCPWRVRRSGPVRLRSRIDAGWRSAPLLPSTGHARILVVQAGLPALPQIRMLHRRITHVGYLARRLIAEGGFENLRFYQADFPLLPGPVARAELHTLGDCGLSSSRLSLDCELPPERGCWQPQQLRRGGSAEAPWPSSACRSRLVWQALASCAAPVQMPLIGRQSCVEAGGPIDRPGWGWSTNQGTPHVVGCGGW
jgi:hypothetical protein